MTELALQQPELIGREEELNTLKQSLNNAIEGIGSTIFISGEAGIGKTRLVSELIKEAEAKDVQLIQGWCLAESLEPLMPIKTALREAGLFHLISGDPPPLVVSAYLMNDAGLLIAKSEREELDIDAHIFSSMLKAVGNFVKDSMQMVDQVERTGGLNILGYKEYKIIIEEYEGLHLASVTKGSLSEFLVTDMKETLTDVQKNYGTVLKDWDGDLDKVTGVENIVSRLVTSGKYNGKFLVDDPKIRQENIFDNVLLGLQRLSSDKPTLLFLDDLQWADPTTLNLLHYLTRNTKENSVLTIGTYRPEEIVQSWDEKTHKLTDTIQKMNRDDLLNKIELKRLDQAGTEALVKDALGNSDFNSNFFKRIFKETEGTPFFVLEVVKLLVEDGAIAQDKEGVWKLITEIEKLDIPSKVYDVVKRRLDKLMKEQREILECASVVGEEFQSELVGKTIGINKIQLLKNLSEIEKVHNLIHYLSDKYRFDHAKIKEILYNGIGGELRKEYHRIVGDTISELYKETPGDVVSELAYHYYEAGDERAGGFLIKAGDQAKEKYANEEAIRFYNNALTILKDKKELKNIYENLGDIHLLTGEYESALNNYLSAVKIEKENRKKADIHRKVAQVYQGKVEFKKGIEECDKGLELLQNEECIETTRLLRVKSLAILLNGDLEKANEIASNALKIAEKFKDKKEIALAHNYLSYTITGKLNKATKETIEHLKVAVKLQKEIDHELGLRNSLIDIGHMYMESSICFNIDHLKEVSDFFHQGLEISQKIGDKSGIAYALQAIGDLYLTKGNYERALEYHTQSLEMSKKIGSFSEISFGLRSIGHTHKLMGEYDKVLEYYTKSLELIKETGFEIAIISNLWFIGFIYVTTNELDKALKYYEESLNISKTQPSRRFSIRPLYLIGDFYKHKGKLKEALEYYNQSLKIEKRMEIQWSLLDIYCGLTEVFLKMGNTQKAYERAKKALNFSKETEFKYHQCKSHRTLGMVYREMGEWEKSNQEFEKSRKILNDYLFPSLIWWRDEHFQWHYEYGLLYKAKGEPAKAREHLEKALSMFEEMGMKLFEEKCRKALEDL